MISTIGFLVMFIACAVGWKRRNLVEFTVFDRLIMCAILAGYWTGMIGLILGLTIGYW